MLDIINKRSLKPRNSKNVKLKISQVSAKIINGITPDEFVAHDEAIEDVNVYSIRRVAYASTGLLSSSVNG